MAYNELIVETTVPITDLRLFDARGALVQQLSLQGTMERTAFALPHPANGLYLVSVRTGDGRWWRTGVMLIR